MCRYERIEEWRIGKGSIPLKKGEEGIPNIIEKV